VGASSNVLGKNKAFLKLKKGGAQQHKTPLNKLDFEMS
jgi:hypothetical protein